MTNNNYYNTILPFIQDLDENIVNEDEQRMETTIDFINPVSNVLERVVFTHVKAYSDQIEQVLYIPAYHKIGEMYTNDEFEMVDLQELYDFILIDEE